MDNNNNNNNNNQNHNAGAHFFGAPHIGATLQSFFRNIISPHSNVHSNEAAQEQQAGTSANSTSSSSQATSAVVANGQPVAEVLDREMTPVNEGASSEPYSHHTEHPLSAQEDATMGEDSTVPRRPTRSRRDDGYDSMPELQSVSDSSEGSAHEVEMMPDLQPVDDDRDSTWVDEDDLPPLEPIAGSRRARVEGDGDEARDRRHPSQRVDNPPEGNPPTGHQQWQPPFFTGPADHQHPILGGILDGLFNLPDGAQNPFPEPFVGIFPDELPPFNPNPENVEVDPSNPTTANQDANANAQPGQPGQPGVHRGGAFPIFTTGITFSIPLTGPPRAFPTRPPGGNTNGQAPPFDFVFDEPGAREELVASFGAFLQQMHAMGAADDNREDPDRAKKLVAGLEVVPIGLVKRLERVGGAPGGHVDDASTIEDSSSNSPGCAICWDTLLDAESDGFRPKQASEEETSFDQNTSANSESDDAEARELSMDAEPPVSSAPSEPSSSSSATDQQSSDSFPNDIPTESDDPKIIVLPCSHVFHASCLLPWFSRARNATCPTCRFNIDPENLTYTPRPFHMPGMPAQFMPGRTNAGAAGHGPVPEPAAAPPPTSESAPELAPESVSAPVTEDVPLESAPANNSDVQNAGTVPTIDSAPALAVPSESPPVSAEEITNIIEQLNEPFGEIDAFEIPAMEQPMPAAPEEPQPTENAQPPPDAPNAPDDGARQGRRLGEFVTVGVDMFVDALPETAGGPSMEEIRSFVEGLFRNGRATGPPIVTRMNGHAPPPFFAGAMPFRPAFQAQAPGTPGSQSAPSDSQPQPQPQPQSQTQPQSPPRPRRLSQTQAEAWTQAQQRAQAQAQAHAQARAHAHTTGGAFFPPFPRPTRPMPPRPERKTWTLPSAPGPSLRQRVEQKEREAGLRCFDMSCGIGPSDEDPFPELSELLMKQVVIHPLLKDSEEEDTPVGSTSVCPHTFHPSCLVSAERVAGWGGEDKVEPQVEVSCPVCRAVGSLPREEWEEGVKALV